MQKELMAEALCELGVNGDTLSVEENACLDRDGYLVLPGVLSPEQAAQIAKRLDELAVEEGERAGLDFHTEQGTTRLGALFNKDPLFDVCFTHPYALAAVNHVLGEDFGLSSLTGRAAQPGEGHQGLHRDDVGRCANVLWIISDFTSENGPTRLVPGSHQGEHSPDDVMADPAATHPDERLLIAPAGSMVVIDGWTWHGGTRNNSQKPRHLVSAFFTRRDGYQQFVQRRMEGAVQERLSAAALHILDHAAV